MRIHNHNFKPESVERDGRLHRIAACMASDPDKDQPTISSKGDS